MDEIVVVGDVHEGLYFDYRLDPETGVSARAMDIHTNFARAARFALEKKSRLFVVVGDLFDRCHVSPSYRELVRKDIIEPLENGGVYVWLIAGNHDQPHSFQRATSLDDFRGYRHVRVFRKPEKMLFEISEEAGREAIGFVVLPYLHPEQLANLVKERHGDDIGRGEMFTLGQRMLREWMKRRVEEFGDRKKILFAHYFIEGSRLRETSSPEVLPDEFSLTRDMIPEGIDIAVFGHVHLHQVMREEQPILYTGAVERIDMGERNDAKGFISLSPSSGDEAKEEADEEAEETGEEMEGGGKSAEMGRAGEHGERRRRTGHRLWRFNQLPVREMKRIEAVVTSGDREPTAKVIEKLSGTEDAIVSLIIKVEEGMRERIDTGEIARRLENSFHYEVRWEERMKETAGFVSFSSDQFVALDEFTKLNYSEHPKYEEIRKRAAETLKEVIE